MRNELLVIEDVSGHLSMPSKTVAEAAFGTAGAGTTAAPEIE